MLYGLLCRLPPICIALVVHQTCFVVCRYKMVFFWTSITPDRSVWENPGPNGKVRQGGAMERTIVSFGVVEGQPEPFQPLPSTRVRKTKKGPKKAQLYKQKIVLKKIKK